MASAPTAKTSICDKLGLKALNRHNILYHYAPAHGVISYTALSVNVMNPSLIYRVCSKRDVTNILLCQSVVFTGLYLYNRPHLRTLPTKEKLLYSSFGAVTFSLGSVLTWAILRSVVPQNVFLCTIAGVGSGLALVKIARTYVEHVDSLVEKTA